MSYVLDTNVVSELRKGPRRAHAGVQRWAARHRQTDMYLSAVTVLEIELGVMRIRRRDEAQANRLQAWLEDEVLAVFAHRILPIDVPVARQAARLHVPDPRPERDALIAATALVHGCTIVSRNTADFAPMGVALVNPWSDRD